MDHGRLLPCLQATGHGTERKPGIGERQARVGEQSIPANEAPTAALPPGLLQQGSLLQRAPEGENGLLGFEALPLDFKPGRGREQGVGQVGKVVGNPDLTGPEDADRHPELLRLGFGQGTLDAFSVGPHQATGA